MSASILTCMAEQGPGCLQYMYNTLYIPFLHLRFRHTCLHVTNIILDSVYTYQYENIMANQYENIMTKVRPSIGHVICVAGLKTSICA